MRQNNLRVCVFIIAFLLFSSLSGLNALQEGLIFDDPSILISLDFQDASLKNVLKIFSIQSGLNFIASEAVEDRQFTVYFDQVPVKDAMDHLFKANNLSYELDRSSNIFTVKDLGEPDVELETKVFYLKYASVSSSHLTEEVAANLGGSGSSGSSGSEGSSESSESGEGSSQGDRYAVATDIGLTTAIKKLLSDKGAIIEDYRTNSLIVQDVPNRMPIIEETLAKLDVAQPLIMIEVEMLDASKSLVDKLGFNWGQTPLTMTLTGPQYTGFGLANWPTFVTQQLSGKSSSMTPGTMNFNTAYSVSLDLLKQDSETRYLARPKILTLNNETAEFEITANETIDVVTGTTSGATQDVTTETVQREQTGITLRVTPQINMDTGEITMFVMPTVKDTSTSSLSLSDGSAIKDPETRTTKSIVRVRDGETIIIGGLLRRHKTETIKKLPILGDLPIVGAIFRHKDKERDLERELLVFITPHIIKDKGMELTRSQNNPPLASLPVREQDVSSVIDRKSIINASLNGFGNN